MALVLGIGKGRGFTVKKHLIIMETLLSPTSFEVAVFRGDTLVKSGVFVGYEDKVEVIPEVFLQAGNSSGKGLKCLVTAPKKYHVSRVKHNKKVACILLDVGRLSIAKAVLYYWDQITDGHSEGTLREFLKLSIYSESTQMWEYGDCSFLIVDNRVRKLKVYNKVNRLCKYCLNSGRVRQWDDELGVYQNIKCTCE